MNVSFGSVKSIYICASAGEPMKSISSVRAIQNKGLAGDRYCDGLGFWQTQKNSRESIRHVSFIKSSDIEGSGFDESETRRNIIINTDINLLSLIGKKFLVGNVLFEGVEDCTPCKRPSQLSGKPNFNIVFKNTGGLRAKILSDGIVNVGDWCTREDSNL